MDIELARTFLKIIETGNFVSAAERLHVTQAAVSRRIKQLEEYLGCTLFVRNKAGAVLTASGKRFERHAVSLVRGWERARQDVGVAPPYSASITVGARFGLWEGLLLEWIGLIRERDPDVVLQMRVDFEPGLMRQLIDGSIDIGVMYTPQQRPGLCVEQLLEEDLILVRAHGAASQDPAHYVYVEWGPEFYAQHGLTLPQFANPSLVASIGWLGLQHILAHGGSGYFPERLVRNWLLRGELERVTSAPTFKLPAYVVFPADRDRVLIDPPIAAMHELAAAPPDSAGRPN